MYLSNTFQQDKLLLRVFRSVKRVKYHDLKKNKKISTDSKIKMITF